MKKFICIILAIAALCGLLMGAGPAEAASRTGGDYEPVKTMDAAHEIAELARALGLDEADPIILRAKELWHEADGRFWADVDIVATVIYNEAWGGCSERHRELVAAAVVNRVRSESFPGTVYDVVAQRGQYRLAYTDPESVYGRKARQDPEAWGVCQEIAARALRGEVDCPADMVYQAEFRQGSGVYEVHKTSYSTTYFCFG